MKQEIDFYLQNHNPPKKRAKKDNLRYCNECGFVWESYWTGKLYFKKYKDVPTYGLERIKCDECKSKEVCYG